MQDTRTQTLLCTSFNVLSQVLWMLFICLCTYFITNSRLKINIVYCPRFHRLTRSSSVTMMSSSGKERPLVSSSSIVMSYTCLLNIGDLSFLSLIRTSTVDSTVWSLEVLGCPLITSTACNSETIFIIFT